MENANLIDIIIYFINFLVTFLILYLLLYKPVSKFLHNRKERILISIQEAEERNKEADLLLAEAQSEVARASETALKISHETIEHAAVSAEKIIDDAEDKAAAILASAREKMDMERQIAQERALTDIVAFSGDLTSRILEREVTLEDNQAIIERFFAENAVDIDRYKAPPTDTK
ncbi:MAG: ATP synthase F0 subunit B [Lachnospiraceae bacterium]